MLGGLFYSTGALKFRRAIWHGHVVGGSIFHYVAAPVGMVLARRAG
jgi:hemolysin III